MGVPWQPCTSSQGQVLLLQLWLQLDLQGPQGPGALPISLGAMGTGVTRGACISSSKFQAEAPQVPWALDPLVAPKAQPLAQLVLAQVLPLWLQQVP